MSKLCALFCCGSGSHPLCPFGEKLCLQEKQNKGLCIGVYVYIYLHTHNHESSLSANYQTGSAPELWEVCCLIGSSQADNAIHSNVIILIMY